MAFELLPLGRSGDQIASNILRLRHALARAVKPKTLMGVADWAEAYRRFSSDAPIPGPWRHAKAPYLVEIMEALSPDDPMEEGAIKKCAQSGGSASAENWIGYVADQVPGPMMYVQATAKSAEEWATEKFWPMVEASPRLGHPKTGMILPQNLKDGTGSTRKRIKFRRGGYMILAGANSAPTLRQRTIRFAVEDDLDQFPDDLDKQGSPEVMISARLKVYRRLGLAKRLKISTPTEKGSSKIEVAFLASDRRHYYLVCPHCSFRFDPVWEDVTWPDGDPEGAYLVTPCCQKRMDHYQKEAAMRSDGWLSLFIDGEKSPRVLSPDAFNELRSRMVRSRRRGWWIGGLITSFQTWGDMARNYLDAQGHVAKLKAWTNLDYGEAFEVRGEVPDHERLYELRDQDWGRGQVPIGAVILTMGVDVQGDGIYFEVLGWGPNQETWSVDVGFVPGPTDVAGEGAWATLDGYARRQFVYPGGLTYPIDMICVDAGYHTAAAQAFCRGFANRLAVFGRAGWTLPVLGRGEALSYNRQGRKSGQASKRPEDKAYLVGTFGVKSTFYGFLRSTLLQHEEARRLGVDPEPVRGLCHFHRDQPMSWFEQVTSEHVETVLTKSGFPRREWKVLSGRQNHWLDCRVYNHAAAEKLMLDTGDEASWARTRAQRYALRTPGQGDLLDLLSQPVKGQGGAPAPSRAQVAVQQPIPRNAPAYIEARDGWL